MMGDCCESEAKECVICGKMKTTGVNYGGKKGFHCTLCEKRKWHHPDDKARGCQPRSAFIIKESTILYDRLQIEKEITGLKAARILNLTVGMATNRFLEVSCHPEEYEGKISIVKPKEATDTKPFLEKWILKLEE